MSLSSGVFSQSSEWEEMRRNYEMEIKEVDYTNALTIAKKMNEWANQQHSNAQLAVPISLRYIGDCFAGLEEYDSAFVYLNRSKELLEKLGQIRHLEYACALKSLGEYYNDTDDYAKALSYYLPAKNMFDTSDGSWTGLRARLHYKIADTYFNLNKFDSSVTLYLSARDLFQQLKPPELGEVADVLNDLGDAYYMKYAYTQASDVYRQALEINKRNRGEKSEAYATTLKNIADLHFAIDDFATARNFFEQYVALDKELDLMEIEDRAQTILYLGTCYRYLGSFEKAESKYKQASSLIKSKLGENHPKYLYAQEKFGELYYDMGQYKTAEKYYLSALNHYQQPKTNDSTGVADMSMELGNVYRSLAEFSKAETYYKQALTRYKEVSGDNIQNIAITQSNLGALYMDMGDFKRASQQYELALEIRKNTLGVNSIRYARSLVSYALILNSMGDYKTAERTLLQAISIKKKIIGEKNPEVATNFNSLGTVYTNMGDHKTALNYQQQSQQIFKTTVGEEHPSYVYTLMSLGIHYSQIGDDRTAADYFRRSLSIRKSIYGENHPLYAYSLSQLGVALQNQGMYATARSHLQTAFAIQKKALGENHPTAAYTLSRLGLLHRQTKEYAQAEACYKKAIAIRMQVFGSEHPDYAASLSDLGNLYAEQGNYSAAEPCLNQALTIQQKVFGQSSSKYIATENDLAFLLLRTNRESEAYKKLEKNSEAISKRIVDDFEWLGDNQKEVYWRSSAVFYDRVLSNGEELTGKIPEATTLLFNIALLSKSKLLEAKISSENYYRDIEEVRELLTYKRRVLVQLESDGSTQVEQMELLRNEADSLDKRLTLSWPEYAQQKRNLSLSWEMVRNELREDEAAIEFIRYRKDDKTYQYSALIVRPSHPWPILVRLCSEDKLKAIQPNQGFGKYYTLIWKPIEQHLTGIKTIYYAPTGELNNIPFAALYEQTSKEESRSTELTDTRGLKTNTGQENIESNTPFLLDRYQLHQLTSTRYLAMGLRTKSNEPTRNSIVVVGGVNYDYLPGIRSNGNNSPTTAGAVRTSSSGTSKLEFLPGSQTEAQRIEVLVTGSQWKVRSLIQDEASEETLIKLEGKEAPGILHIATHGYAFDEPDVNDTADSKNIARIGYRYNPNPMVRSGIILAGGNWAWLGSDTLTKLGASQNGILTALEVSQLNLRKTKLVVLSACQTGLGKIEGSEGTFGLKRGFKLAGVEQIIVSLWAVPDKETMELMTEFYGDLIKTLNPVASFETAQKIMRNRYPSEPWKWAGFVLVR